MIGHLHAVHPHAAAGWSSLLDALLVAALVLPVLLARSLISSAGVAEEESERDLAAARELVSRHGEDSLAPFIVRPDKRFAFAAGGVLAYRLIGRTAVVSGDPVAPPGAAPAVLAAFLRDARSRGWQVVVYGAGTAHLAAYRRFGLHTLCVGEEAIVDPATFTLEGRAVRKLRQSVHRVARRGWEVSALAGREVDAALEAEIDAVGSAWRSDREKVIGFAMGMGRYDSGVGPDDLFMLARGPDGRLGAVMRFICHRGKLSLDTMRRVGETPNGLNEALVVRALERARELAVPEVSLNYAGLAHLVRNPAGGGRLPQASSRVVLSALAGRFQMERLVRFNDKFDPQWRGRHLVYASRRALPLSVLRVLQAEGYLPEPRRGRGAGRWRAPLPALRRAPERTSR